MKHRTSHALLLAAALLAGPLACQPGGVGPDERPVIATVSGAPVYLDEYLAELKRTEIDGAEDGLPTAEAERIQHRAVLDDLIQRRLLLQEADRHNVVVGMDEVDALYQRLRGGWADTAIADCPDCTFDVALDTRELTPGQIKHTLRESLMVRKYFRDHVFSRIAVTDEEIEAYLDANPGERSSPEKVHAQQILVKTAEEAEAVATELRQGMPFADAAMKYSLSPEGRTGGDLGTFARGDMPAIFNETCFALRPGSISRVVASDFGFHLFKVLEHIPGGERPLHEVRDAIEARLRKEKERVALIEKVSQLRKAATIEIAEKVLARAL